MHNEKGMALQGRLRGVASISYLAIYPSVYVKLRWWIHLVDHIVADVGLGHGREHHPTAPTREVLDREWRHGKEERIDVSCVRRCKRRVRKRKICVSRCQTRVWTCFTGRKRGYVLENARDVLGNARYVCENARGVCVATQEICLCYSGSKGWSEVVGVPDGWGRERVYICIHIYICTHIYI